MQALQKRLVRRIVRRRARHFAGQLQWSSAHPYEAQQATLHYLMSKAKATQFGREHDFASIRHDGDLRRRIPLRDYEALQPYLHKVRAGEPDVLWPGRPIHFAYTSGTTSGIKYIPITNDSLKPYIGAGRYALSLYIVATNNVSCLSGKVVYFTHHIEVARFSGITAEPMAGITQMHLPGFVRKRFLPTEATNRLEDFEQKIDIAVEETLGQDVTLINGIPPWIQLYFNKLMEKTGTCIADIFPHFSVLIHGGVGIEPYRANLERSIGKKVDTIEVYPASEGFIAFQDVPQEPALLLNLRGGIFYEFVPVEELSAPQPTRLSLRDVELDRNYALILHTNAGLWGYILGDTIKFVSNKPYRLVVTGRTSRFLSTSGEHVIAEEVETALAEALQEADVLATEFTVAPHIHAVSGLPYHEWFIEFSSALPGINAFAARLNTLVGDRNINYAEFCQAGVMLPLQIQIVRQGGFVDYMKAIGKLGGQNKVPHLSNDRRLAEALSPYVVPRV